MNLTVVLIHLLRICPQVVQLVHYCLLMLMAWHFAALRQELRETKQALAALTAQHEALAPVADGVLEARGALSAAAANGAPANVLMHDVDSSRPEPPIGTFLERRTRNSS